MCGSNVVVEAGGCARLDRVLEFRQAGVFSGEELDPAERDERRNKLARAIDRLSQPERPQGLVSGLPGRLDGQLELRHPGVGDDQLLLRAQALELAHGVDRHRQRVGNRTGLPDEVRQ